MVVTGDTTGVREVDENVPGVHDQLYVPPAGDAVSVVLPPLQIVEGEALAETTFIVKEEGLPF